MRNPFAPRRPEPNPADLPIPSPDTGGDDGIAPAAAALGTPEASGKASSGGPASAAFTLRDLLVVTYAVPAERLRPHVPADLPLEMLPGPDGERLGFLQTVVAFHADARWSLLPEGAGRSFHQLTQRALVRREGRRGAFQFRALVGSDEARNAQRALTRDAEFARFSIYIAGDPARATYDRCVARAVSDTTQAQIDVRITPAPESGDAETTPAAPPPPPPPPPFPFSTHTEAAAFLADRPDNYFRASAPRAGIGVLTYRCGTLPAPLTGTVTASRNALWTTAPLSLLTPDDLLKPFSVLVLPSVEIASSLPRFAKFK